VQKLDCFYGASDRNLIPIVPGLMFYLPAVFFTVHGGKPQINVNSPMGRPHTTKIGHGHIKNGTNFICGPGQTPFRHQRQCCVCDKAPAF
jgi:hypothetical protein